MRASKSEVSIRLSQRRKNAWPAAKTSAMAQGRKRARYCRGLNQYIPQIHRKMVCNYGSTQTSVSQGLGGRGFWSG